MKHTKKALLMSALSMLLCLTMLVGSTFAWFTDTVTAGKNKIVAGNLDVELEYWDETANNNAGDWITVDANTSLFETVNGSTLWEPGHTEYVKLRIRNAGTLALKYTFGLNIFGDEEGGKENTYTSVNFKKGSTTEHETFKLSDYLVFNKIENIASVDTEDRTTFWDDSLELGNFKDIAINGADGEDAWLEAGKDKEFYLVVYMPTTVGNEANQLTSAREDKKDESGNIVKGEGAPTIYLGLTLFATQTPYERDSFSTDYDEDAKYLKTTVASTKDEFEAAMQDNSGMVVEVNWTGDPIKEWTMFKGGVNVTGNIILNVGDKSITNVNSGSKPTFDVTNGGSLTINAAPTSSTYNPTATWLRASGKDSKLVINNGTYSTSFSHAAVTALDGSTVVVNEGVYSGSGAGGEAYSNGTVTAKGGSKVTVNGGSFSSAGYQTSLFCADNSAIIVESAELKSCNGKQFAVFNGGIIKVSKNVLSTKPTSTNGMVTEDGDYWVISAN